MRRRTLIALGMLVVVTLAVVLHTLDLPGLLGPLNPHALP
jgi:hypothetical protein